MVYVVVRQFYLKRLLVLFYAVSLYALATPPVAEAHHATPLPQHGDRIVQCKGQKGMETNRRELEDAIEKYRKGETPSLGGIFYCREAFPVLQKYALDPDPKVRDRMAFFLRLYYSPAALQVLVQQLETYPDDPSAFPAVYAGAYPCYFFRQVKAPSLAQALVTRIKSREDSFKREEIYLLGCFAPRDARALSLLEEMSGPTFMPRLDEQERVVFSKLVTYALAEGDVKEAEEQTLADIEAQSKDPEGALRVLEQLKQFTNCRILRRFAQFITDKRPGSEVTKVSDLNNKTGNGLVRRRVGDDAILRFASVYGDGVVGIGLSDYDNGRAFTDAEMERIYQRVTKALGSGKYSTCRGQQAARD